MAGINKDVEGPILDMEETEKGVFKWKGRTRQDNRSPKPIGYDRSGKPVYPNPEPTIEKKA